MLRVTTSFVSPSGVPCKSAFTAVRGDGVFKSLYSYPYVTTPECHAVKSYMDRHGLSYIMPEPDLGVTPALEIIKSAWTCRDPSGELSHRRARRSNLPYMNHIYEGLYILRDADPGIKRAWCLHPVFQDPDLEHQIHLTTPPTWVKGLQDIPEEDIELSKQYAITANAHLSYMPPKTPRISSHPGVNAMLVADKIQNLKELCVSVPQDLTPNWNRLMQYFNSEWFPVLGITPEMFRSEATQILLRTGRHDPLIARDSKNV
jgi:hypothetical protein